MPSTIPAGFGQINRPNALHAYLEDKKQRHLTKMDKENLALAQSQDARLNSQEDRLNSQEDRLQAGQDQENDRAAMDAAIQAAAPHIWNEDHESARLAAISAAEAYGKDPSDFDDEDYQQLVALVGPAPAPEDYTLDPGDQRRSGVTDELIASNPKPDKPAKYTIKEIGGRQWAINEADPSDRTDLGAATGSSTTQRDTKVADYQRLYGMSEEDAVALADGHKRIEIVEQTGDVRLIDERTNEVTEIPLGSTEEGAAVVSPNPGETLYDLAEYATGPVSEVAAGVSVPLAWAGLAVPDRTVVARQTMKMQTQNLIRALSVNPRFPVAEMNRIKEEVKLDPSFFDAPELMRLRMKAIDTNLRLRLANEQRVASDPNSPQKMRQDAEQAATHIDNFINILGFPQSEAQSSGLKVGTVEDGYRYLGGDPASQSSWERVD